MFLNTRTFFQFLRLIKFPCSPSISTICNNSLHLISPETFHWFSSLKICTTWPMQKNTWNISLNAFKISYKSMINTSFARIIWHYWVFKSISYQNPIPSGYVITVNESSCTAMLILLATDNFLNSLNYSTSQQVATPPLSPVSLLKNSVK